MLKEISNIQSTGYTACKIFHLYRNEPENYNNTRWVLLVHNYINYVLTGGIASMEPGDVSGSALWNPKTGNWSLKVINAINPNLIDKLPPVKDSRELLGKLL